MLLSEGQRGEASENSYKAMLYVVHIFIEISTEYKYFLHRPFNLIPSGVQNALSVRLLFVFLFVVLVTMLRYIHTLKGSCSFMNSFRSNQFQLSVALFRHRETLVPVCSHWTLLLHMLKVMRVKGDAAGLRVGINDLAYRKAQ